MPACKQNGAESKTCEEIIRQFRKPGGLTNLSEKLLFIQAVLKGLASVDKYNGNFVGELAAKVVIGFDVHLPPMKTAPPLELGKFFLHDLAKVAPFARINDDFARQGHRAQSSKLLEP